MNQKSPLHLVMKTLKFYVFSVKLLLHVITDLKKKGILFQGMLVFVFV